MKQKLSMDCLGCQATVVLEILMPSVIKPTTSKYLCDNCESSYIIRVIRPKGSKASDIKIEFVSVNPGEKFHKIMAERTKPRSTRADKMGGS